jgi:hypothetical protein
VFPSVRAGRVLVTLAQPVCALGKRCFNVRIILHPGGLGVKHPDGLGADVTDV